MIFNPVTVLKPLGVVSRPCLHPFKFSEYFAEGELCQEHLFDVIRPVSRFIGRRRGCASCLPPLADTLNFKAGLSIEMNERAKAFQRLQPTQYWGMNCKLPAALLQQSAMSSSQSYELLLSFSIAVCWCTMIVKHFPKLQVSLQEFSGLKLIRPTPPTTANVFTLTFVLMV